MVSKSQIVFEGRASIRFKSAAYTQYMSILKRIATQPSDTRWVFETISNHYHFHLKYVKPSKIAENTKFDEFV